VADEKGQQHNWRQELVDALAERQQPDGSWINKNQRWMEADPNLVTGYALLSLSYCREK
jgi:squalene-hopene/tetraprenyl-beta-curcumene cyclase